MKQALTSFMILFAIAALTILAAELARIGPRTPQGDPQRKPRPVKGNRCPSCHMDLTGKPIPDELLQFYSGQTHYSERRGVLDPAKDRVVRWRCPACGHEWEREG